MSKKSIWTDQEFTDAVKASKSYAEVLRRFGLKAAGANYNRVKRDIKRLGLDISHMTGKAWNVGERYKKLKDPIPLEKILVKDSTYKNTYSLKNRIFKEGLKEKRCECCGNTTWLGKEIPLELHHINGDHSDLRIENLQILCPNCHSLTDNYRGKGIKKKITKDKIKTPKKKSVKPSKKTILPKKHIDPKFCKVCGKELTYKQIMGNCIYCSQECAHKSVSKKPSKEELLLKFKELKSFLHVGKYYGVTDNAVRKWCKGYGILEEAKRMGKTSK